MAFKDEEKEVASENIILEVILLRMDLSGLEGARSVFQFPVRCFYYLTYETLGIRQKTYTILGN